MIELTEIVRLADRYLNVGGDIGGDNYTLRPVLNDDIDESDRWAFDFRLADERFKNAHLTLKLIDKNRGSLAGNTSILLVGRENFRSFTFWRRNGSSTLCKVALHELPIAASVPQIVTHGFVRSPSIFPITYRYVRFVMTLGRLCAEQAIPMLVEPAGRLSLGNRTSKLSLALRDLSLEEWRSVGCTRPSSVPAEKMARLLGLDEMKDTFNVRTLGKVFFSVPWLE